MKAGLDIYIAAVKTLPTAPGVLVSLIDLFQQPNHDVDGIAKLMRQDPSLTANVLRHANSVGCLPEQPIVDVFDAIAWIGFSQVYQAVVAKLASQSMRFSKGGCAIDVDELWHHSVIAGVCTGAIAKSVRENEALAFTAGLLHDVGKIVLSMAEGAKYTALTNQFSGGGSALQQAEEIHFGFGHAEVGARLLARWRLPEEISEPVRRHHQVDWVPAFERISATVCLGNLMAHVAEDGVVRGHFDCEEAVCAMRVLKLEKSGVNALLDGARNDIQRMTELLGATV